MKKMIIILAVIAAFVSCSIPQPDNPVEKPKSEAVMVKSSNVTNAKAFSKGSPVYYINSVGEMVLLELKDKDGNTVTTEVFAIAKSGTNWLIVKLADNTIYLLNTISGEITSITGYINPNYLVAISRGNYIYFGSDATGIVSRYEKSTGNIIPMNTGFPITFQQNPSYAGFYIVSNDMVVGNFNNKWKVLTLGEEPKVIIPNPPENFSVNNALWDYIPAGNLPEIYDANGTLCEIRNEYQNNMGVWSTTFKVRKFNYSDISKVITNSQYPKGLETYCDMTNIDIASVSGSSIPLWFPNCKNQIDKENRNRKIFTPAGYLTINGLDDVTWTAKDLTMVINEFWMGGDYLYWLTDSSNINRIQLSPTGNPETVVTETVVTWGVASKDILIYNTADSTKKLDLNNVSAAPVVLNTPAVHISTFISMN
jgi:hypothetical protein